MPQPTLPRVPARHRQAAVVAGVLAFGAVAALTMLRLTSPVQAGVGPGRVEVRAVVAGDGATEVALPPLGRIVASTHRAPLRLDVRLDELDVERLQRTLSAPKAQQRITEDVTADLPALLRRFVIRSLLTALVVGAVAGALVSNRRLAHAGLGAAGGLFAVGSMLLWTWQGYDTDAFAEARFEGALKRAPAILEAAQRSVGDIDQVGGLVQTLSQQVAGLYAATDLGVTSGETLILHVSDIHSNPLGLELVGQLAESFDVDAVVDTGDLTSYGSPVESRMAALIDDMDVPYYLVPGNHDSEGNREAFAAGSSITVLDGDVARVGQVRILGIGDPTFTADNVVSTREANERKEQLASGVAAAVRRDRPDLLAVHDLRQAGRVAGWVDTVVAGHTHDRSDREEDGTTFLTVGSTGATGLGSFLVETQLPYEAQILRFDDDRLVAVDYVTLEGVDGNFRIDRRVMPLPDAEVAGEEDDGGEDDGDEEDGGTEVGEAEGDGGTEVGEAEVGEAEVGEADVPADGAGAATTTAPGGRGDEEEPEGEARAGDGGDADGA